MSYEINRNSTSLLSEENVKKYILPFYNLDNSSISQIKFKDTDKQRAVYKVESSSGVYCLKKVYYNKNDLLFIYSAVEWLWRSKINVPKILSTQNGGRFVDYKGMLFFLTKWINGVKCDYDTFENILASSLNLAKMHTCSKNFKPVLGSTSKNDCENIDLSLKKHMKHLLICNNLAYRKNDKFSIEFLKFFEKNEELAKTSITAASTINFDKLSVSLCHLDYVNKNLIFDENNQLWVIDFDKCSMDYCVHDISYFLRRFLKRDITNWDIKLALDCLDKYDKVKPLNFEEYKYIFVYLSFPQKFWKISRDYYNNINKCNQKAFLKLLLKSNEGIDYHLNFMKAFKVYIENKFSKHI